MAGFDYVYANVDLIFASGSGGNDTECASIPIIDDTALEGDQMFFVTLTSVDPDVMLGSNVTGVTIADSDG